MSTCAACHGSQGADRYQFTGANLGKVEPNSKLGTDPGRLDSYTEAFRQRQLAELFAGTPYQFKHFVKTDGYANLPLDGLWLRGPYLHNGAVPTLRDLLAPPAQRPVAFVRGIDLIDGKNGGFVAPACEPGRPPPQGFCYDTRLPGNGNGGHVYGTSLAAAGEGRPHRLSADLLGKLDVDNSDHAFDRTRRTPLVPVAGLGRHRQQYRRFHCQHHLSGRGAGVCRRRSGHAADLAAPGRDAARASLHILYSRRPRSLRPSLLGDLRRGVPVCRHDLLRHCGRPLYPLLAVRLRLRRAAGDLSLSWLATDEGRSRRLRRAPRGGAGEPARRRVLSLEQLSVVHGAGRADIRVRRGAFQIRVDRQRWRQRHSVSDLGRHAGGLRPSPAASAGLRRVRSALRAWTQSGR